jgi:gamma-glutamyltranspeptidase / glutathione hydrolase
MTGARIISMAVGALLAAPDPLQTQRPTSMAGRSTVYAPNGAVATSQPLASAAGLEVLRQGGDMFAIVWLDREQKLVALNASGRAGSLMTRATLQARGFRSGSQHPRKDGMAVGY